VEILSSLVARALRTYWEALEIEEARPLRFPDYRCEGDLRELTPREQELADCIGLAAAELADLEAGYQLGTIYTVTVPESERAAFGVYYTPPALAERLLDMVELAGIDWSTCRVLDPACGGGAFLAPVAKRMRAALVALDSQEIVEQIALRLRGLR
jgi:adenine-specific DNA-methyltransferase